MKKNLLLSTQAHTENLALTEIGNNAEHEAMQIMFHNIEKGLERVSHIVHNMTIANEPNVPILQSFDVNACVKAIAQKLSKQIPNNINISMELTKLPHLFIDVYKISQLLKNLIINASEAIKTGGEIRISTVHYGSFIEVSVSDNGSGIELHLQDVIFDPCYSTKKEAAETGLGLAISKDIALEHGGELEVSSIYGEGSVFTLQLPVDDIIIH